MKIREYLGILMGRCWILDSGHLIVGRWKRQWVVLNYDLSITTHCHPEQKRQSLFSVKDLDLQRLTGKGLF